MTTRLEWAERVDRLERSGLDAAEFARREGLELEQLEAWRRELRAAGLQEVEPQCQAPGVVTLDATASPTPPAPAWVDLRLPDGGLVRLAPGIDATTAACVLAAVGELSTRRPENGPTCASPSRRSAGGKK